MLHYVMFIFTFLNRYIIDEINVQTYLGPSPDLRPSYLDIKYLFTTVVRTLGTFFVLIRCKLITKKRKLPTGYIINYYEINDSSCRAPVLKSFLWTTQAEIFLSAIESCRIEYFATEFAGPKK